MLDDVRDRTLRDPQQRGLKVHIAGWEDLLFRSLGPGLLFVSSRHVAARNRVSDSPTEGPSLAVDPCKAPVTGVLLFSGGPSILVWIYPNELFPTEVRATAVGIATAISRFGAATGTYLLPLSIAALGTGTTMLFGALLTGAAFIICLIMAPETKGKSLEEASVDTSPKKVSSPSVQPGREMVKGSTVQL